MKQGCGFAVGVVAFVIVLGIVIGALNANTSTPEPSLRAPTQAPRAPTPSAPSVPVAPIELEGSGTATRTRTITLSEGLWAVGYRVKHNTDNGRKSNFVVKIEAVAGSSELIANEIEAALTGTATMRVGNGLFDLIPGKAIASVDAAKGASWSITLVRQ